MLPARPHPPTHRHIDTDTSASGVPPRCRPQALNEMKPTVIGGLFTEITTRKVVLVILAVLVCSSFASISVDEFDGNISRMSESTLCFWH